MKTIKALLSLLFVVAVLLASTISAHAIGFEAETAYESVFVIYSGDALGSGFAVGKNCIITNAHVIDNRRNITVVTYGETRYRATVLGMNEHEDIAVLIVDGADFPCLKIADLSTMKTGDDIYAIGAPKGMAYTLTKGGISAKERTVSGQTYIQIDAPINEGNSGGPLLNDAGQVLGVNTLKMNDSEGLGLAIPITRVCSFMQSLGITLDDSGNVVGSVTSSDGTTATTATSGADPETPDIPNDQDNSHRQNDPSDFIIALVAVVVAALSLATNVILTVLLIHERKKHAPTPYAPPPYDPSERTDFDIEILE